MTKEQRLIALIEKVMWQPQGDPDYHDPSNDRCVFCGAQRPSKKWGQKGHREDCEAVALLAE